MGRDGVVSAHGASRGALERLLPEFERHVVIDFDENAGNAGLAVAELRERCGTLSAEATDLLRAAGVVHLGDAALKRGVNEEWSRDITFSLSECPARGLSPVALRLSALLGFVLGDRVEVSVRPADETGEEPLIEPTTELDAGFDCVCLLSGGLDSLAGAVALLENGRKPLLLSHETGNPVTRTSRDNARRALAAKYGPVLSASVSVTVSPRRDATWPFPEEQSRESSRRGRSFVPLVAAAVVARAAEVDEVWIPENGVLAAQLPLTRARVGSFTTRTTHPRWLRGLEGIFTDTLGGPVRIINPLLGMTKSEAVGDLLLRHLGEEAVRATDSCWAVGRQAVPCGACIPCAIRRIAFAHCEMGPEAMGSNPFTNPTATPRTEGRRNVLALLSLVRDFALLEDARLFLRYPELAYTEPDHDTTMAVLRRFALEVAEVCRREYPESYRILGLG